MSEVDMSAFEEKTYFQITTTDLGRLILGCYPSFPGQVALDLEGVEEWDGDSFHPFHVDPSSLWGKWDEYDQDIWDSAMNGEGEYGITRVALSRLAIDGRIQRGHYLIEVSG